MNQQAIAGSRVYQAVRSGRLVRKPCADCGATNNIQGHHHNGYDETHLLDVIWLCGVCHMARHNKRPQPGGPPELPYWAMREATGLSQRELERRLGWGSGWLSQLEHGYRNPEREAALRVLLGRLLVDGQ